MWRKARGVEIALAEFGDMSNRAIAEMCGVGHEMVLHARKVDDSSTSTRTGSPGRKPGRADAAPRGREMKASKKSRTTYTLKSGNDPAHEFGDVFELRKHVAGLALQEHLRALARAPAEWWAAQDARVEQLKQLKVRKRTAREARRRNASQPRGKAKHITKAKLIKFRDDYVWNEGTPYGWKTRACNRFKVTMKTLNARMRD